MLYQRSLDIEQRLRLVLDLVRTGEYSAPQIAAALHVSLPTVSRALTALRERGHDIRSGRRDGRWRFFLRSSAKASSDRPRTRHTIRGSLADTPAAAGIA